VINDSDPLICLDLALILANTTAVESLSYPGEGEYGSMRCAEDLAGRAGLEFRQLVVQ
jgi:hypothetical protein